MFMMKGPHEEESTVSEWATRWGKGLLTVCQNSSLLTLVHICKSGWPSPLSVFDEYLPWVEDPFISVFYHKKGACIKGEPGELQDREDPLAWDSGVSFLLLSIREDVQVLSSACPVPRASGLPNRTGRAVRYYENKKKYIVIIIGFVLFCFCPVNLR